jgi:hypothetical protein
MEDPQQTNPGDDVAVETPSPPTVRMPLPPRQEVWPVALGVVAIIWGAFGLLSAPITIVMWRIMPEAFEGHHPGVFFGSLSLGLVLTVLLVYAGVRVLKRKKTGVRLLRVWAIVTLIWAPIGLVLGYSASSDTMFAETATEVERISGAITRSCV